MLGPADCSLSDWFAAIAASASFAASASSDVRLLVMGDPAGELAALTLALTLPSRGSPLADLLRPDLFPPPLTPMLPMLLSMLLLALLIIPEGERSMDDPPALGGAVPAGRTGRGTGGGGGGGGSNPSESNPSTLIFDPDPGMFTPPASATTPLAPSKGKSQRHSWQSCPVLPNRSVSARSSVTSRSS